MADALLEMSWIRIKVPTPGSQEASLPPDGGLGILYDGEWCLGRFESETMTWHYDDGSAAPISDYDGDWWHPLPDVQPIFAARAALEGGE